MQFTYQDQVSFAKLALMLFDQNHDDAGSLSQLLAVGEMIKRNSDDNNGVIFDITEYIYERIRILKGEENAFEDVSMRARLQEDIQGQAHKS